MSIPLDAKGPKDLPQATIIPSSPVDAKTYSYEPLNAEFDVNTKDRRFRHMYHVQTVSNSNFLGMILNVLVSYVPISHIYTELSSKVGLAEGWHNFRLCLSSGEDADASDQLELVIRVTNIKVEAVDSRILHQYDIYYTDLELMRKFMLYCQRIRKPEPIDSKMLKTSVNSGGYWGSAQSSGPKRYRDTLFFGDDRVDRIIDAVRKFQTDETIRDHETFGIPHVFAAILHGPPGSGKSSLINVLASEMNMTKYVLSLKGIDLLELKILLRTVRNGLIVLEDIDAIYSGRTSTSHVSFGDFINVLDGSYSLPGTIFVMTTNHLDRLDPALFRAGRVKMMLEFSHIDKAGIRAMWDKHYEHLHPGKADEFMRRLADLEAVNGHVTPAELLMFMFSGRRSTFDEVLAALPQLFEEIKFRQEMAESATAAVSAKKTRSKR